MSSKKIIYTNDFKLRVLDYYFKHGGDDKFGLKKKTASHFNIDKKTINRMLSNADMVKRARKLLAARKASGSSGAKGSTSSQKSVKPVVKKGGSSKNTNSTSSKTSSTQCSSFVKGSTSSTGTSIKSVGGSTGKQIGKSGGSKQQTNFNIGTTKGTPTKSKFIGQGDKGTPNVKIYDLPEDPDYSILKHSIDSSSNDVARLTKLLVTATEEVQAVLLNECNVILECKVCRNLFRSVVNFLAHKRIYCQDEIAEVRTMFHKGDEQGITTESNTIVLEPEPPPESGYVPSKTNLPTTYSSISAPVKIKHSGIDNIALKLARKRKAFHAASGTSATHEGSSSYFQSLGEVASNRDKLSRDCSVVLEDIGIPNAMYQAYISPGATPSRKSMLSKVEEASHSKDGITVAINQNGDILKTASGTVTTMDIDEPTNPLSLSSENKDLTCVLCNTSFATQKTLSVHQRSVHGFERCIYYCPICQTSFLSMWAVVKHLQRTHKKTKSQIERLRKVVKKNIRKKPNEKSSDKIEMLEPIKDEYDSSKEDEDEEEGENTDNADASLKKSPAKSPVKESPHKREESENKISHREESNNKLSPDHHCIKCERKFNTQDALESHGKFCSLLQMSPPESASISSRLMPDAPEKRITIQIRKDYKKVMSSPVKDIHRASPSKDIRGPSSSKDIDGASCVSDDKSVQNALLKVSNVSQENKNFKVEAMMSEFCNLSTLVCVPCGNKFPNMSALKMHAAEHLNWTRFSCKACDFRSYYRYKIFNHCVVEHKLKGAILIESFIVDEEQFGNLKYILPNEEEGFNFSLSSFEQGHSQKNLLSPNSVSNKIGENSDCLSSVSFDDSNTQVSHMSVDYNDTYVQKQNILIVDSSNCFEGTNDSKYGKENEESFSLANEKLGENQLFSHPKSGHLSEKDVESGSKICDNDSNSTSANQNKVVNSLPFTNKNTNMEEISNSTIPVEKKLSVASQSGILVSSSTAMTDFKNSMNKHLHKSDLLIPSSIEKFDSFDLVVDKCTNKDSSILDKKCDSSSSDPVKLSSLTSLEGKSSKSTFTVDKIPFISILDKNVDKCNSLKNDSCIAISTSSETKPTETSVTVNPQISPLNLDKNFNTSISLVATNEHSLPQAKEKLTEEKCVDKNILDIYKKADDPLTLSSEAKEKCVDKNVLDVIHKKPNDPVTLSSETKEKCVDINILDDIHKKADNPVTLSSETKEKLTEEMCVDKNILDALSSETKEKLTEEMCVDKNILDDSYKKADDSVTLSSEATKINDPVTLSSEATKINDPVTLSSEESLPSFEEGTTQSEDSLFSQASKNLQSLFSSSDEENYFEGYEVISKDTSTLCKSEILTTIQEFVPSNISDESNSSIEDCKIYGETKAVIEKEPHFKLENGPEENKRVEVSSLSNQELKYREKVEVENVKVQNEVKTSEDKNREIVERIETENKTKVIQNGDTVTTADHQNEKKENNTDNSKISKCTVIIDIENHSNKCSKGEEIFDLDTKDFLQCNTLVKMNMHENIPLLPESDISHLSNASDMEAEMTSISENESSISEEVQSISDHSQRELKYKEEKLKLIPKEEDIDTLDYKEPPSDVAALECKESSDVVKLEFENIKEAAEEVVNPSDTKIIKPHIPKDDLSLEAKDFIGFTKLDETYNRPQRVRRSIEMLDFIYFSKKRAAQEMESDSDSSTSQSPDSKQEARRKTSPLNCKVMLKKVKCEEGHTPKYENDNLPNDRRSGRIIQKQLDFRSNKPVASSNEENRLKAYQSGKESDGTSTKVNKESSPVRRNSNKNNETNFKASITKESPTAGTRFSSRLKTVPNVPLNKKEKQHKLNSKNSLANGQEQTSKSIALTSSRVKL